MDLNRQEIGQRIREIRKNNNLTYEKFGELLGSSSGTVSNWENGRYSPNKQRLEIIAQLGKTSVAFILWGELEPYITQFLYDVSSILETNLDHIKTPLINLLEEQQILFGEPTQLFKALLEVAPELETYTNFNSLLEKYNVSLAAIRSPRSDADYAYKFHYAPLIRDLFIEDFENELWSEKQNHQIMLRVLDMLVRTPANKKQYLNHLIQQISWISCHDIVENTLDNQSSIASYGGVDNIIHSHIRTDIEISDDFQSIKQQILHDLDLLIQKNE